MTHGWDDIDWALHQGAYGPATDAPDILRAIASPDPQAANDGRFELHSTLYHQGSVYPATVVAVPFLVELAVRPGVHGRAALIATIGNLCDPDTSRGQEQPAVHAAIAAVSARLLPGLEDPDPEVREATAYALARSGPHHAEDLRARWAVEPAPAVRASLLLGIALHDAAPDAALLRTALTEPFPVPLAAAFAGARAGLALPAADMTLVAVAHDQGRRWLGSWHTADGDPSDLTRVLPAEAAAALTDALLARPTAFPRQRAAAGLESRFRALRSAPPLLMDRLARLLDDPDAAVRAAAVSAADAAGRPVAAVADRLASIAAATDDEPARTALDTLIRLGDARWKAPALAVWSAGRDLSAARLFDEHPPAFDAEVLAAVRQRLSAHSAAPAGRRRSIMASFTDGEDPNASIYLVQLLGTWGPAAADAVPELIAAYDRASGVAPRALAAIGPAALPAVPALRERAAGGDIRAGHAVWNLTRDPAPLVAAIGGQRRPGAWDLRFAAAAGTDLAPAVPHLQTRLRDLASGDAHIRLALAEVLWRATGDPGRALPVVAAVLADHRQADAAASLAAELAPAGAELAPGLWRLLSEGAPWSRVDAARALWKLGTPVADLVPSLLATAADPGGNPAAVTLLADMDAVTAVPGLVDLAERDERVVCAGTMGWVWRDDALRETLRAAITRLR
ncbi:hypothetical protein ACFPIJ_44525 [Dactylosporangium cerinum]|uniref:Uncharacterized protein n=1 Tax=Dactylosporangium cerinum TaxID=1434730 RepID=A0ABV9WAU8_9ACTN